MKVLISERDKTRDIIEQMIDFEQNYLFTNDSDYKDQRADIVPQQNPQPDQQNPNKPQPQNIDQNRGMLPPQNTNIPNSMRRGGNIYVDEMRKRID